MEPSVWDGPLVLGWKRDGRAGRKRYMARFVGGVVSEDLFAFGDCYE